jgi:hypothetical protein
MDIKRVYILFIYMSFIKYKDLVFTNLYLFTLCIKTTNAYLFVHYPTDKILKRNVMILINQFRIIQVYTELQ